MSYFATALSGLKHQCDFDMCANMSVDYLQSQEYLDSQAALLQAKIDKEKADVAEAINNYFNNVSATQPVDRTMAIGFINLSESDINELISFLTSKGYTTSLSADGRRLYITG
jgi:hypothetical protein